VNLLLVEAAEIIDGVVTLAAKDRRAEHLRRVLQVKVGSSVRAGIVNGPLAPATVTAADDGFTLALDLARYPIPSAPLPVELLLAIPRPKALTRLIESCAAFGVARIDLTNAWRVDKSYLQSDRLAPDELAHALRLGAEQGATTHIPPIAVHKTLMGLLDSRFAAPEGATRLLAHPDAPPIEAAKLTWPLTLAIGPEGGWIQRELDTFVERGFQLVSIGTPILRTADAVAAALGQLMLLRRR
jgi:RsmE family RNA methyltransferase